MSYLKGWLGGRSTPSAVDELSPEYELRSLQDATKYATLIMNDKYDEADLALSKETSPFHQYMRGICFFQRAILGTEPETIKKGLVVLAEAEQTILSFQAKALSKPSHSHGSDIFPVGTVYSLLHAEIQFAYAVVAIMNANVTDALRALYKIRKSYATMEQIFKLEKDHAESNVHNTKSDDATLRSGSRRSFDFMLVDGGSDFTELTTNPMNLFIHTSLCYSYGLLQWALSIVPAPFDKALSFMSYKGDRKLGHSLMWEASKHPEDIHGALASYTTIIIYNGLSARCDIRPADAVPHDRVAELLHNLQRLYPLSHKWRIQEAMLLASPGRKLDQAIATLEPGVQDKDVPKFITALCVFEQGCKQLFAHRHEACALSFIRLAEYTDWSYCLFHYVVGISYVNAYRKAKRDGDPKDKIDGHGDKASEALGKVMGQFGKKKVLGRVVPIELYIKNNMTRYLAKAASKKCSLVDAVDVSPAEELIWLYGGHDAMSEEQLEVSLEELDSYKTTGPDELARKSLLRAECLRNMNKLSEAKEELEKNVLIHTATTARSWDRYSSNWVLPAAHFDMAVCLWHEAGPDKQDKEKLQACADHLKAAKQWSTHDMQTMHSIKITIGFETLKKLGVQVT